MAKTKPSSKPAECPLETLQPVQVKCPGCGHREFEPARGRFGVIWRCANRPACKFWLSSMPIGKTCGYKTNGQRCGALMVEGTKTIPDRCSDRRCPNRNPHKLNK